MYRFLTALKAPNFGYPFSKKDFFILPSLAKYALPLYSETIISKLSKKEGVIDAKVVFTDSIANIAYDANTTSKSELIAYVNGIAGGDLYTASETLTEVTKTKKSHTCSADCKEKCELKAEKKGCCSGKTIDGKMICAEDCKMACCDKKETV